MRQAWRELMLADEGQAAKRSDAAMKKVLIRTLEDAGMYIRVFTLLKLETKIHTLCIH